MLSLMLFSSLIFVFCRFVLLFLLVAFIPFNCTQPLALIGWCISFRTLCFSFENISLNPYCYKPSAVLSQFGQLDEYNLINLKKRKY